MGPQEDPWAKYFRKSEPPKRGTAGTPRQTDAADPWRKYFGANPAADRVRAGGGSGRFLGRLKDYQAPVPFAQDATHVSSRRTAASTNGSTASAGGLSEELPFRSWYSGHAQRLGLDPDPDNPLHHYDWRAAYRAGAAPDEEGHWPSEYKREGHPNLIVEGRDTRTGQPVAATRPGRFMGRLSAPQPIARDATRVVTGAPPAPADITAYHRAATLPGFTNPPLPDPATMVGPSSSEIAQDAERLAIQPDAVSVHTEMPLLTAEPPILTSTSPAEQRLHEMEIERERGRSELQELYETIPRPVRVALQGARGVGKAVTLGQLDKLADVANEGVAKLAGVEVPPSVEEAFDVLDPSALEKAAEIGGFLYGAGSLIAAQNRALAKLGQKLPDASRAGRALRSFDPSKPVPPGLAAAQSAAEGVPFDLAYDADTPEQRLTNIAAGLALGAGLGPVFRRTTRSATSESRADDVNGQVHATDERLGDESTRSSFATLRRKLALRISPELEQERRATERAADTDDLTGVANHRALARALPAAEADPETAVLVFDADNFKQVNDRYSYEAGNEVIRKAADAVQLAALEAGKGERVFRYGGDEFVALVPKAQAEQVRRRAEEVFGHLDAAGVRVSLSGGIGDSFAAAEQQMKSAKALRKGTDAPASRVAAISEQPKGMSAPEPRAAQAANVAEFPVAEIDVEPERFQFKLDVDEKGVGQELKSVRKFDPNLAGVIQVWRDPADARVKVINGHHRLELAKRTGQQNVLVRFVDADDAAQARQIGALTSISEGRGTAVDAAKLFRDSEIGPEDLEARGISVRGAIARDGLALSKLHPTLFSQVVKGELPVQRAAVLGGSGLDKEQQLALTQLLDRRERAGRRLNNEEVGELIRFVRHAGGAEVTQASLFGEETISKSLALEKAELSAFVKERLAKDRRLFGYLTKGGRAGRIEETGVGSIQTERAGEIVSAAEQAEEVYNRLSTMSGPIAQALNDAAAQLARGGDANAIRQSLYTQVRATIESEISGLGRAQAAVGGRDAPPGSVRPEEPGEAGEGSGFFDEVDPWGKYFSRRREDTDALEIQDDIFGAAPKVTGEEQGQLFSADKPTLAAAERDARETVGRLEPKVNAGHATQQEIERYRDALALIRRGEAQSAEEVRLRAAAQEADTQNDTADLFDDPATNVHEIGQKRSHDAAEDELARSGGVDVDRLIPIDALRDKSLKGRLPHEKPVALGRGRAPDDDIDVPDRKQMVADLARTLGAPFRVGKFKGKGVLGIYKRKPEVIRSKVAQDIETVTHEAGHHIHKMLFGLNPSGTLAQRPLQPWGEELRPLSYDGSLKEGYAEFVRLYVTNSEAARAAAPNFYEFIETKLHADWPEALAVLQRVRSDYKVWTEAPAQARIRAQRARPEDGQSEFIGFTSPWEKIRTKAVDDLIPLRVLTRLATGSPRPADIAEDAGTLADLARGSAGQAELLIEYGMIDPVSRTKVGPALREVFDPIRNERSKLDDATYENFVDYSIAKRVQYLYEGRGNIGYLGIEAEDAAQVVKELETPEFTAALARYQQWNKGLLRWLVESGVISERAAQIIDARNEIYVPLMRELDQTEKIANRGLLNKKDPIKRIKGSGRQILDPFEESAKRAYEYTRIAAKQRVANAIVQLAEKHGTGRLIEKVPPPQKPVTVQTREVLEKIASQIGLTAEDVKAAMDSGVLDEVITVMRPADFLPENTISVLQKGHRIYYEVDPELYRSLNGLDEERIGELTRIAAVPARTLRAGATLSPEFMLRNPIRDQLMAGVQSEWGYVPFVDLARGMASLLRRDKYYEAFKAGGGARASLLGLDRKTIRKHFREAVDVGGVPNVVKNPIDLLRAMSEFMEDATRVGEARRALDALLDDGAPYGEAVQRAGAAGREVSVDFARKGLEGARLRSMAAFWNAQVQGYDKLARSFKRDPTGTTLRAVSMITVPSVLEYLVYRDNAEYWEIPQWQRDLFWIAKVGDQWIRIPKPFDLGLVFGSLPQRILQWMDRHDPEGVDLFVKETLAQQLDNLVPIPTFAAPLIDNFANYSRFLNRPIVPRGLEGVEPRQQFTQRTGEVSKGLGRLTGLSPLKVENALYSWTGGLGRIASETVDLAVETVRDEREVDPRPLAVRIPGLRGLTVDDPGAQSQSVERLYRMLESAEERKATYDKLVKSGKPGEAKEYYREHRSDIQSARSLRHASDQLAQQRKLISAVQRLQIPAAEKRDRIHKIEERMLGIAKGATRLMQKTGTNN